MQREEELGMTKQDSGLGRGWESLVTMVGDRQRGEACMVRERGQ